MVDERSAAFEIYYSDQVYSGPPEQAPALDVQVIVVPDPRCGWKTIHASDYYVWMDPGITWDGRDIFGLWDYLCLPEPAWKKVLFGRKIPDADYAAILERALARTEFARKSGYLSSERRVR